MTLNSNLPQSESAFALYDNVGPVRRNSELAEIGEEQVMWRNGEKSGFENPYVYDTEDNETLNEITDKVCNV